MVLYGQVVVGAPGSGKTTYCNGMQQYLRLTGRDTLVVNLDPANDFHRNDDHNDADNDNDNDNNSDEDPSAEDEEPQLPYDTILDASQDMINLSSVMEELQLGPNGGLVYCLEYIHHHVSTLIQLLTRRIDDYCAGTANQPQPQRRPPPYLLLDLPGQVELYTHNTAVQSILDALTRQMDLRLAAVHLVDSHACVDASKFISAALLSTTTMLRLELPAVNVLSKMDLLAGYGHGHGHGGMPFNLDFFIECESLDRLLPFLDSMGPATNHLHNNNNNSSNSNSNHHNHEEDLEMRIMEDPDYQSARAKTRNSRFYKKHHKLHRELCEVIDDYSLLSYVPLNINDAVDVGRLVARIDKCNGYVFLGRPTSGQDLDLDVDVDADADASRSSTNNHNIHDMFKCAMQLDSDWGYEQIADVQERYLGSFQEHVPELNQNPNQNQN